MRARNRRKTAAPRTATHAARATSAARATRAARVAFAAFHFTAPPFASPGCPAELRVLSTGELMHRIAEEHNVYTEDEVKKHLLVMLDTMKYMHNQGDTMKCMPLQCRP